MCIQQFSDGHEHGVLNYNIKVLEPQYNKVPILVPEGISGIMIEMCKPLIITRVEICDTKSLFRG